MILTIVLTFYCIIVTMVAVFNYVDRKMYQELFENKKEYADQLYNDFMSYLSREERNENIKRTNGN
jgi:hypothetical protein